ncbi:hypothetical protein FRC11_006734 [Ceratobasidium sp. 423]|nr:hypothetical protein FRC11_006734 [Ceratobasidium sp. 423]
MPRLLFWDKGKWPEVNVNEVRHELAAKEKQPSARRAPERPAKTTDIEADDEGDNDDEEYILPETKTRKNKKPSREWSESPEHPKSKLSRPSEKPSKEKACEKLKSKGVSIADPSLASAISVRCGAAEARSSSFDAEREGESNGATRGRIR